MSSVYSALNYAMYTHMLNITGTVPVCKSAEENIIMDPDIQDIHQTWA